MKEIVDKHETIIPYKGKHFFVYFYYYAYHRGWVAEFSCENEKIAGKILLKKDLNVNISELIDNLIGNWKNLYGGRF